MELNALRADARYPEAMIGRVFSILGVKNEELEKELQVWKCRIVFQGSNVRTKSGVNAVELYEEVSNSPASFMASRVALGCGAMLGQNASLRDGEAAYLQSRIDTPGRIPTFVELPKEWWPDTWFVDGHKRLIPKYKRPVCLMCLGLYGHPEAGALWELKLNGILDANGWRKVEGTPGVFVHEETRAVLVTYVDDMLMVAHDDIMKWLWKNLDKRIKFKDPAEEIKRYLGAYHRYTPYAQERADAVRELGISMRAYTEQAVSRYLAEVGDVKLRRVSTPYLSPEEWADPDVTPGAQCTTCASHVATLLFLARVCRPDISVAVQRLCCEVSTWTVVEDRALLRVMGYLHSTVDWELFSHLGPSDLQDVVINVYTDADWNGDAATTKSTNGLWIEFYSASSGRSWALSWRSWKQTCTSSSTAEAETISLSSGLRSEGLPIQTLASEILGFLVEIHAKVDNTQAITAVGKGYSKKLKHLQRTHRCSIGVIHELINDKEAKVKVLYEPTATHKGDSFTKALNPMPFVSAVKAIGMQPAP
jgi:hypothetical protein